MSQSLKFLYGLTCDLDSPREAGNGYRLGTNAPPERIWYCKSIPQGEENQRMRESLLPITSLNHNLGYRRLGGNLNFQHNGKMFVTQGFCVTEMHIKTTWII